MDELERFLALVERELGSDDAHVEFGGGGPRREGVVWAELEGGWRIVASFDFKPEPGAEADAEAVDLEAASARLEALAAAFEGLGVTLSERSPKGHVEAGSVDPSSAHDPGRARGQGSSVHQRAAQAQLHHALKVLAERSGALAAAVIDVDSPVVWARSDLAPGRDALDADALRAWATVARASADAGVDLGAILAAGDDAPAAVDGAPELLAALVGAHPGAARWDASTWRRWLRIARAIHLAREQFDRREGSEPFGPEASGELLGWSSQPVAGIYRVVLVYAGPPSELASTGVLRRALPVLERLITSLPPLDPRPHSGRLVQLFGR
ncbi:hypothetical protein PPSIR1_31568 [Plesiocystis pacifica SIR-1]|uniref:Uncharacterized protein n=1 Tax=Plesiocystis pacifica SIR-1 TaxID=391625 RepID=A6GF54_9BACT|nr:hypothetical protein [Plesiocystis pacifica]EDM75513.1 hypothetical protein PPSIR1_31568 [Plesiocystis pacifica SIR-1]